MKKTNVIKNKNIILIILLVVIAGSIYYLNSQKAGPSDFEPVEQLKQTEDVVDIEKQIEGIPKAAFSEYIKDDKAIKQKSMLYQEAPELRGIEGYINTDSDIKIQSLKGKVVLVDFWTYTCINCIRTFPYLKNWDEKYRDDGLVIIGVHTPEFEFEKKYENVKSAVEKYELKYPTVQDNNYATWRAYKNRFWPHKYLIDIDGFIRYDHIGEGGYEETEQVILELLNEKMEREGQGKIEEDMAKPSDVVDVEYRKIGTPEIYLGYGFARGNFGNKEGLQPNQIIDYKIPLIVKPNKVYLEGKWKVNKDDSELISEEGRIVLGYDAKVVNVVVGSDTGSEVEVFVDTNTLDESKIGADVKIIDDKSIATIKEERLYNLVDYEYGPGLLELRIKGKGFKINAFTFG
ncbi:MAG: thioredoxin family protein [Nanoarchaeota archaeon]|nr:thioredoxin family protein [Nanoarchaeota archaeon]